MKRTGILLFMILLCVSCIENPLSYPRVKADITAFAVEGQKSVSIDADKMTVNIILKETADIDSIRVKEYAYSEAAVPAYELPELLDLREPVKIAFSTYPDQSYEWTIQAEQPIDRYVKCDDMIEAEYDIEKKSILAYFPEDYDLKAVRFTKMKLEAQGSQVDSTFGFISVDGLETPTRDKMEFPMTLDCVISRKFTVKYRHELTEWQFTALHKIIELEVTSVNAWCYSADINAVFKGKGEPVVQYKEASAEEWIPLKTTVEGTAIKASVDQLTEGTDYIARVVNGDSVSEEFTFTTETPEQLPNMSFDEWHQGDPGGYTWYPNAKDAEMIWGTANSGVNMMSAVNSTRPENTFVAKKGGFAVIMESVYLFGKFAAGIIYTGNFGKAVLSPVPGAELDWGMPFTTRPYSLKGYYAYAPKKIDNASDKYADKLGMMDNAQILVFLTDWEKPFLVSTSTETFVDIKNDPSIIAVGELVTDVDTQGKYVEFECVLEYRDDRKPKYIVAVACSSLYGDYFTGGQGSVMHVDEWEFTYR